MVLCDKYHVNDAKYFDFSVLPTFSINRMNFVGNVPYICVPLYTIHTC